MKKEKSDFAPLSKQVKEIILGSLLGDGSLKIHPGYANARFSFRHSTVQSEYFQWKVDLLNKEIASESCVFHQKVDGFSTHEMIRFQSLALPALTELYRLTHKGSHFVIQRKWLNQMSAFSLAIWWFDDGSIISNGRKGVLCTDGFDEESQETLKKYLKVVWGINVHIGRIKSARSGTKDEYFRLWFRSTEELKKFFRLILPYTPINMLSKILLLYKDTELQQRWISEVAQVTSFSQSEIEQIVRQRKEKWKIFRE